MRLPPVIELSRRRAASYLTVFLSLSLTIILSLFLTLMEGAREGLIRMQAELVTDTAMESVLAEYSAELLRQYDLLFVDTAYDGSGASPDENLMRHLRSFYTENLDSSATAFGSVRSFTSVSLSDLELTGRRYAGDDGCRALAEQIQAYMTADAAGTAVTGLESLLSAFGGSGIDIRNESSWSGWEKEQSDQYRRKDEVIEAYAAAKAAESASPEEGEEAVTEESTEIEIEDPAEKVNAFRNSPILSQVLEAGTEVSDAAIDPSAVFSGRSGNMTGDPGIEAGSSHHYGEAGAALFAAYVLEKCGCYTRRKENSALSYELEYLLSGRSTDRENLERTAGKLLVLRTGLNFVFLETDSKRKGEAEALVAAIPGVLAVPGLATVLTTIVLLAWSYVESVKDVKTLLAGKKVPVMKTDSTWSSDLADISNPGAVTAGEGSEGGVSYEDYLKLFIFVRYTADRVTTRERLMDIIETDIRQTENGQDFRMDRCLDTFGIRAAFDSAFGYSCSIERTVTYN